MPPKKWVRVFFKNDSNSGIEEGNLEVEPIPGFSEQDQVREAFKERYGDRAILLDFCGEEI